MDRGRSRLIRTALLFFSSILIPGVVLTVISLRSLSREEAFFRSQIETSIQGELSRTIVQINSEIAAMETELRNSLSSSSAGSEPVAMNSWAGNNLLIDIPFRVSESFRMLEPLEGPGISDQQQLFLTRNSEFLTNRIEIPVWQNIARLYREDILKRSNALSFDKVNVDISMNDEIADSLVAVDAFAEEEAAEAPEPESAEEESGSSLLENRSVFKEELEVQKAVSALEQDSELQEQIYEQLEQEGAVVTQRMVVPSKQRKSSPPVAKKGFQYNASQESEPMPVMRVKSILVANERNFAKISAEQNSGLIPRIQNDRLSLMFWMRLEDGSYAGGSVNMPVFLDRLAQLMPEINNGVRIINLMNEYGTSLLDSHPDIQSRSWLSPFVSREISETVPGWELAVQLADSNYIRNRADQRILTTGILIALLAVAMLGGGALLYLNTLQQVRGAMMRTGFVANVSHELKTPLTSIRMYAEMLKQGRLKDQSRKALYLDTIVSESERLTRLINNVLDFSRLDKQSKLYDLQEADLSEIACDLLETQRIRLEQKGFAVECIQAGEPLPVMADGEAVRQVLINLISNAEKYSDDEKRVRISLSRDAGEAVLLVEDSGIGVPHQARKSVFKEFYRVDDRLTAKVSGSGLGLAISRKIIEDHNGSICCRDSEIGGAGFEIRLPLRAEGEGNE